MEEQSHIKIVIESLPIGVSNISEKQHLDTFNYLINLAIEQESLYALHLNLLYLEREAAINRRYTGEPNIPEGCIPIPRWAGNRDYKYAKEHDQITEEWWETVHYYHYWVNEIRRDTYTIINKIEFWQSKPPDYRNHFPNRLFYIREEEDMDEYVPVNKERENDLTVY